MNNHLVSPVRCQHAVLVAQTARRQARELVELSTARRAATVRPLSTGDQKRFQVSPGLARSVELATAQAKIENLEIALVSARRIGMAIGILMARQLLTEQQAFEALKIASQHQHRKVRELAEDVIFTGAMPPETARHVGAQVATA